MLGYLEINDLEVLHFTLGNIFFVEGQALAYVFE